MKRIPLFALSFIFGIVAILSILQGYVCNVSAQETLCFELESFCAKFTLTIAENGQITGINDNYDDCPVRIGGYYNYITSGFAIFCDFKPQACGHGFEYGTIVGEKTEDKIEGSLYRYFPNGTLHAADPTQITLKNCGAQDPPPGPGLLDIEKKDIFESKVPAPNSSKFCFKLEPFDYTFIFAIAQDGQITGIGDNCDACPIYLGGYYNSATSGWVMFCDFRPQACDKIFEYGIIVGSKMDGWLYLYYPDSTLYGTDPVKITLKHYDLNADSEGLYRLSGGGYIDSNGGYNELNPEIRIPIRLEATSKEISSFSFEAAYDASKWVYSGFEPGEMLSSFGTLDVTDIGGKLKVEAASTESCIQRGASGYLIWLKFEPKEVQLYWDGSLEIRSFSGDLAHFSSTKGPFFINIIDSTTNIDLELSVGWNLVSLPVEPIDKRIKSLFREAKTVFEYTAAGYILLDPNTELEIKKGYWLYLPAANTYSLQGTPVNHYVITNASKGWSIIGTCSSEAKASVDIGNIRAIYGYTPGFGYQRVLESGHIKSGKGYWINLSEQTTIIVNVDSQEDTDWHTTAATGCNYPFLSNKSIDDVQDYHYTLSGFENQSIYEFKGPIPDIKANESDGPIIIPQNQTLSLTIKLDYGDNSAEDANWWLVALTPWNDLYFCDTNTLSWQPSPVVHRASLENLSSKDVLNTECLPAGNYIFCFGIDMIINGEEDLDFDYKKLDYKDSVEVLICKEIEGEDDVILPEYPPDANCDIYLPDANYDVLPKHGCPMAHCDIEMSDIVHLPPPKNINEEEPLWSDLNPNDFDGGSGWGIGCSGNGEIVACSFRNVNNYNNVIVYDPYEPGPKNNHRLWTSKDLFQERATSAPIVTKSGDIIACDNTRICRIDSDCLDGDVTWCKCFPIKCIPYSPVLQNAELLFLQHREGLYMPLTAAMETYLIMRIS